MAEYVYECYYCGKKWGGMYRVHDPVCSKCGSEGDFYVKTRRVESKGDAFNYEEDEKIFEANKARRTRNANPPD